MKKTIKKAITQDGSYASDVAVYYIYKKHIHKTEHI